MEEHRHCHPPEPGMPAYLPGDELSEAERALLERMARLIHELDARIPLEAIAPERTLWEIGYDSLALVQLRLRVKREFGAQPPSLHWLRLHEERPRIGCFVRFLAASGAQ